MLTLVNELQETINILRENFSRAVFKVKALKTEISSLKEEVDLLKSGRIQIASQLLKELQQRNEQLMKAIATRQAHTQACTRCLVRLAQKDSELKSQEEQWKAKCEALLMRLQEELALRHKSLSLNMLEELPNHNDLDFSHNLVSKAKNKLETNYEPENDNETEEEEGGAGDKEQLERNDDETD